MSTLMLNALNGFSIEFLKNIIPHDDFERKTTMHIHDFCEIYINISGNVSFIVEKNIYSIQPGDIILTKPYEFHQCIYHDDTVHSLFWITFSIDDNPDLFRFITEHKNGTHNLIRLPDEKKKVVLSYCEKLASKAPISQTDMLGTFFSLISCIEKGIERYNVHEHINNLPQNVNEIVNYINKNFASIKSIRSIAETFHISIATLERYFKKYLSMTPRQYLETKKLFYACILLRKNVSVTDACYDSGFDDYTYFISVFKKNMNTTPFKYKKLYNSALR